MGLPCVIGIHKLNVGRAPDYDNDGVVIRRLWWWCTRCPEFGVEPEPNGENEGDHFPGFVGVAKKFLEMEEVMERSERNWRMKQESSALVGEV